MSYPFQRTVVFCASIAVLLAASGAGLCADGDLALRKEVEQLREENKTLRTQVHEQDGLIENLSRRVTDIERVSSQKTEDAGSATSGCKSSSDTTRKSDGLNLGKLNISGEGGIGLFDSQKYGTFPNTEFRVDEAKLFVETPVLDDIYFFAELNLAERESSDLDLRVGELYLDFENVSQLWNRDRMLNVRIGRMDIPFGEEYLMRDAIDNPLISHSLSDSWGSDAGVELYGALGKVSYVVAVQNGGAPLTRDYTSDKSVAARVSYDPSRWLHLSLSAMRTGELDAGNDYWSAAWFGGGWFKSIGSSTTTKYHANLVQGDVGLNFSRGHLKAFAGFARYDDNDPAADNQRDFFYYAVEGVFDLTRRCYAAARFSQIIVDDGYPLPGNGNMGDYYYNPALQAENLWRLSLGLGYRVNPRMVIKAEYSLEHGKELSGAKRDDVDFLGAEAAFKF